MMEIIIFCAGIFCGLDIGLFAATDKNYRRSFSVFFAIFCPGSGIYMYIRRQIELGPT